MRALLGILLATSTAGAQPKPAPTTPALPSVTIHVEPQHPFDFGGARLFPGFGGKSVYGLLYDPGSHPDMHAWPKGMLFAPPDIGDDNVIVPGTNSLPWWRIERPQTPLSGRLAGALDRGVGALFELVIPHSM